MEESGQGQVASVASRAQTAPHGWWSPTKLLIVTGIFLAGVFAIGSLVYLVSPKPNPDRLWSEAEAALRAGRISDAESQLSRVRALRKPTPQDLMLTAQLESARGRNYDAMTVLRQIPEDHPLGAQAWYLIGRIEREAHRIHKAELAYRKAVALEPRLVPAHRELIYIYGMLLRRRELDAEYDALARIEPLTHYDLFTRGLTHFIGWNTDSAAQLESFIEADPGDRYSRLALAKMFVDQPGARAKVEAVLAPLGPDDLDAKALLIELELARGDVQQAIAHLEASQGQNAHLSRLRGRVALMKGDPTAAIGHFQKSLEDQPYDRSALSALAKALTIKGDTKAAEAVADRARKLDDVYNLINRISRPGRENAASDLAALGHACEAAGLIDEAKGWFDLAIARNPLDAESQQALQRIRNRSAR
jgi:tetratricopeptide (TPR) repeat protein